MPRESVACIGAGVIGNAWAALFAAHGYRVMVQDCDPAAERALGVMADRVAMVLDVPAGDIRDHLTFTADLETALAGAAFVQESAPESLALKQRLLADIDRIAPVDAVIASSTSDFPVSLLQSLRSEEHTSELQSLMRISYAVFCLKKKKKQ